MIGQLDIQPCATWSLFPGSNRPLVIAGPCSAESEEQLFATALRLREEGVRVFRAGIWKPRTRPNSFEGVGARGLPWLQRVRRELGLNVATEVANAHHVEQALRHGVDLLWVGARSTTNPFVVQEIAEALRGVDIPVLVKNPVNPDIELWMGALERLYLCGVTKLGAIHRGFSAYNSVRYRNQPQWQIPIELKRRLKTLPLFCDPSHIGGRREYVAEIAQKAMDLGFEGLMVEAHLHPECALSDAAQQITPERLRQLLARLVIRNERMREGATDEWQIEELREKIDALDNVLLETLTGRMKVIEEIGRYKKAHHLTILQPDRWEQILSRVQAEARENGLPVELVERIFKAIHQASIDRQTDILNR